MMIYVKEESRRTLEVTGSTFNINFEIIDPAFKPESQKKLNYFLKVNVSDKEIFTLGLNQNLNSFPNNKF